MIYIFFIIFKKVILEVINLKVEADERNLWEIYEGKISLLKKVFAQFNYYIWTQLMYIVDVVIKSFQELDLSFMTKALS